jgi:hypothetical protein
MPLVLACAAACGPVTYVGDVRRASELIEDARAADAARLAPYWWTRAVEYLHRAREVAARADFQGAHRFGELAASAASQAAADARIAAKDPSKRPRDLPPDVAPARPTEAPVAPAKRARPTEAPIAPTRDLPAPPRSRVAPAKAPP